ncbi:hypothetical protein B0A48_04154 [Cryoendolithus antarcticus]|uniref:Zn(2)-C6 fungal-type domain-containing protein n=1 Tax=Cryoendolithus antarcticus TaxID=1507870 RepID=A0A1V8THJ0_9PEZI|nr:hypothetical protein B0A48_04154 [Cryoendolithus antarcticus]
MERDPNDSAGSDKRKRAVSSGAATDAQAKRSRVSRACDQCRSSREKCVGGTGSSSCQTCEAQNRHCTYDEPPKKRGIQPNYIRTLELALAWVVQYAPEAQTALSQALPLVDSTAYKLISGKDASGAELLHQSWRDGLLCKQIDQLLSGSIVENGMEAHVPRTINRKLPHFGSVAISTSPDILHPRDVESSANSNAKRHHDDVPDGTGPAVSEHAAPSADSYDRDGHFGDQSQRPSVKSQPPMQLKLPLNSWNLLDYFFAFTQSWLPITEKHSVLRTTYSYPGEGLSLDKATGGAHAELWSMLALAAYQVSCIAPLDEDYRYLSQTARQLIPRIAGASVNGVIVDGKDAVGKVVTSGGTKGTGFSHDAFESGHVRALLILALLDATQESWPSAWLNVGIATRLLLLDDTDTKSARRLDSRTLLFAAFVIDSTISSRLGLRSHIRGSDLHEIDALAEDGMEEWAPWADPITPDTASKAPSKAWSTFNAITNELRSVNDSDGLASTTSFPRPLTVRALLVNACTKEARVQPAKLVATLQAEQTSSPAFPIPAPTGGNSIDLQEVDNAHVSHQEIDLSTAPTKDLHSNGFMTIPSGPGDFSYMDNTQNNSLPAPSDTSLWPMYDLNDIASDHDIFEELAMLDPVEPLTQQPQFMQNLGFNNPDLDLAEFFGADYQATSSLLTYIQPTHSTKPGGEFG